MLALVDAVAVVPVDDPDLAGAGDALRARQREFKSGVEGHGRLASKRGGRAKPKTTVEVGLLLVDEIRSLNDTLKGIMDVYRQSVSATTQLSRRQSAG